MLFLVASGTHLHRSRCSHASIDARDARAPTGGQGHLFAPEDVNVQHSASVELHAALLSSAALRSK